MTAQNKLSKSRSATHYRLTILVTMEMARYIQCNDCINSDT